MKVHPHELLLQEFVDAVSEEHRRLIEHLLLCEACRERIQPFLRRRGPTALTERMAPVLSGVHCKPCDYSQVLQRGEVNHQQRLFSFDRERAEAHGLFSELLAHPQERRRLILANRPRFHTWGLLELLIERGRETGYADPAQGENLGELALCLADRLDAEFYGAERIEDLKARAWASISNSRRVLSDLTGAEAAMEEAFLHLRRGTGDLLERAIVLDLRASLLRAQRRFPQALRLLQRAVGIFLEYGDTHRAGRSLLNMGNVHSAAGTPEEAIPLLYQATELIDTDEEPLLVLAIWHNLIDDLANAGRYLEAHGLFLRAQPIYRRFPDSPNQNRRKWLQGKISRGLGQAIEAEVLFLAARDGFLAAGITYNAALVCLDLASLFAEQRRTAELKSLAEEIFPIFASKGIHREALAALLFLRQAITAERASLDLVTRIAGYLKRAQHDPELRFEQS
jgi:tetratricopeptide (TPR) repeat protein